MANIIVLGVQIAYLDSANSDIESAFWHGQRVRHCLWIGIRNCLLVSIQEGYRWHVANRGPAVALEWVIALVVLPKRVVWVFGVLVGSFREMSIIEVLCLVETGAVYDSTIGCVSFGDPYRANAVALSLSFRTPQFQSCVDSYCVRQHEFFFFSRNGLRYIVHVLLYNSSAAFYHGCAGQKIVDLMYIIIHFATHAN